MERRKIHRLATGGLMAALVLITTFAVKIPVPATGGYVHAGDGAIFLSALLLGPYAALAAGVGSALADLLGGYVVYALPTFLIKAAMGCAAGFLARKGQAGRNCLAFSVGAAIMVGGYFLFEGFLYGWPAAAAALLPNIGQGAVGVAIGVALCFLPLHRLPGQA